MMMIVRYPPPPYDWETAMERFDDHLTDEETVERQAEIRGPYPAPSSAPGGISWTRPPELAWQAILGLIGSGIIAILTVLAFVVL